MKKSFKSLDIVGGLIYRHTVHRTSCSMRNATPGSTINTVWGVIIHNPPFFIMDDTNKNAIKEFIYDR
jgi:hypothetical protein